MNSVRRSLRGPIPGKNIDITKEFENIWVVTSPIQYETDHVIADVLNEQLFLASVCRQNVFFLVGGILLTVFLAAIVLRAFHPFLKIAASGVLAQQKNVL